MHNCSECGKANWKVVNRLGSLQTWQCEACGYERQVHVADPSVRPETYQPREPIFRLLGLWKSMPTSGQIAELRNLAPRLKRVSDAELIRVGADKVKFELGRFNESEVRALNLESKLLLLGVEVERMPAPIPGPVS